MKNVELSRISVNAESKISDIVSCIQNSGSVACCLYYNNEGKFENIFTDGDVRRAFLAGRGLADSAQEVLKIKQASSRSKPITANEDATEDTRRDLFTEHSLRQLVLVDQLGDPVDVIGADYLCHEYDFQKKNFSAIVMAGGFGTRMRPFTDSTPKPMLKVNGRPILEISIMKMIEFGVRKFYITTHYLPEKIMEHFGDGSRYGVEIKYINEDTPLGTGGALALVDQPDEHMLVFNGDILTNLNVRMFFADHMRTNACMTIASTQYHVEVPFGVIAEEDGVVAKIDEKPVYKFMVNSGMYFLSREVFQHLPASERFNMTDVAECLIEKGKKVSCFPIFEHWLDVGRPSDYDIAATIFE